MPIYEYDCPKCGRFDSLQKMSAAPLKKHEACGSKVTKVMSASAFAFKGSGFYITDYKGRNSAAITGREPKPDSKGESKGDSNGDSKADSKSKTESKADGKGESKADAKPKPAACASCPASKSAA